MSGRWTKHTRTINAEDGQVVQNYWERPKGGGVVERVYSSANVLVTRVSTVPIGLAYGSSRARGQRSTTTSPGHPAVVIDEKARSTIIRHAERSARDGRESGGWLLGRVSSGRIEVERAVDAATTREPTRVLFDLNARGGILDDAVVVGDWHTHPAGSVRPSDGDLKGWAASRRASNGAPWLAVIAGVNGPFRAASLKTWITDARGTRPLDPGARSRAVHTRPKEQPRWRL